jgi:hypothetical protein
MRVAIFGKIVYWLHIPITDKLPGITKALQYSYAVKWLKATNL